jgi:hypothetical protein
MDNGKNGDWGGCLREWKEIWGLGGIGGRALGSGEGVEGGWMRRNVSFIGIGVGVIIRVRNVERYVGY